MTNAPALSIDSLATMIITQLRFDFHQNFISLMNTIDQYESINEFIDAEIDEIAETDIFAETFTTINDDEMRIDAIMQSLTDLLTIHRDALIEMIATNFNELMKLRDIMTQNARANIIARIELLNEQLAMID